MLSVLAVCAPLFVIVIVRVQGWIGKMLAGSTQDARCLLGLICVSAGRTDLTPRCPAILTVGFRSLWAYGAYLVEE